MDNNPLEIGVFPATQIEPRPPNTIPTQEMDGTLSMKELERELPVVKDGQIPLPDLLSRVVQSIFAEMTEIAETCAFRDPNGCHCLTERSRMPSMSDQARKRTLADFCVKTKKQVAKLYAVMRWSRDATLVQKCMVSTPPCPWATVNHLSLLIEPQEYYGIHSQSCQST
jgi:hypothetical protein